MISKLDFLDEKEQWAGLNSLVRITHWTFDVTFNGHAPNNFALVKKIALNLLKAEELKNMSIKSKRLVAVIMLQIFSLSDVVLTYYCEHFFELNILRFE